MHIFLEVSLAKHLLFYNQHRYRSLLNHAGTNAAEKKIRNTAKSPAAYDNSIAGKILGERETILPEGWPTRKTYLTLLG